MERTMDCARCAALLDERIDGGLAPADAAAFDAHCAGCARCAERLAVARELLAAAAGLRGRGEPVPDAVWRGIAARTVARSPPAARLGWAVAATVVLALGAVIAVQRGGSGSGALDVALPTPRGAAQPAVADPGMARRAHLVSDVFHGGRKLDPATLAVVEHNLKVIHAALAEIEVAVAANPNDPNLRRLLTEIHQQESALIERTQRISIEPNRRTDI